MNELGLGLLVGLIALMIARVVILRSARVPAASEVVKIVRQEPSKPIDEQSARREIELRLAAYESELLESAHRRAKEIVLDAVQRTHLEGIPAATTDVVTLPGEDVKGRLIGREGRNIRAFEQVTGVDLIIDDAPNTVSLSCFDPYRRAIAKRCLEMLLAETKVYPAKVEEAFAIAEKEIAMGIRRAGEDAAKKLDMVGLTAATKDAVGRLQYRTSYAQNVYNHSIEVAQICGMMADELGLDRGVAMRAGLLHDIGKSLPAEWEGPHAIAGMRFLESQGEPPAVTHAVGAHHREIAPASAEAELVIIADALSSARPGARRESLEQFMERMRSLEEEIADLPGVDRVFAVQAGREVRVVVSPDQVDDQRTVGLAEEIANRIAADHRFPGQIKVTVIREVRSEFTAG